jgi:hypothetical protein
MSLRAQPSLKVDVRNVELRLAEIAEETLAFLVPNDGTEPPTRRPHRAHELYDAMTDWMYTLPDRIRLEEAVLPSTLIIQSVLFVRHTYYRFILTKKS